MNFGEKLKSLRIKHELSQENLAEKLNVSRQAITK
ncbi:helix-turn-helix transcriptional regulator [Paraclostridium tenue]